MKKSLAFIYLLKEIQEQQQQQKCKKHYIERKGTPNVHHTFLSGLGKLAEV